MEDNLYYNDVIPEIDAQLFDHLSELIIRCDARGYILYANAATRVWIDEWLECQPFVSLLVPDVTAKGRRFLEEARLATVEQPTPPWELVLGGNGKCAPARFRGYGDGDAIMIVGEVEPEYVSSMQQELVELTSELSEAQREMRRQNRALKKALEEQQQLTKTILELTAPAVPIWDGVLLLPLVGYIDSDRAKRIREQLLRRVECEKPRYVILDVSGIADIDTMIATHLIQIGQSLRLLGVSSVLVGVTPAIAQALVNLGVEFQVFRFESDLQHAVAYVLRRIQYAPMQSR